MAVGSEKWETLKKEVVDALLAELPNHSDAFMKYVDNALQIEDTIGIDSPPYRQTSLKE